MWKIANSKFAILSRCMLHTGGWTMMQPIRNAFLEWRVLSILTAPSQVRDVMKKNDAIPICKEGDLIMDQLTELTSKGCGCLLVVDEKHHLIGTFTDGDLRRTLKNSGEGIFKLTVGEMCNRYPANILEIIFFGMIIVPCP